MMAGASSSPPTPVRVVGLATTDFALETDAMLDELVFEVVHRALREAGLRRPEVGLSVTASMDAYDGRSISAGLTAMAAGGLLSDGYRVEGDGAVAVIRAAEAVAAGDVDVAVAVAVHNPERRFSPLGGRSFLEQISNLAYEPHLDRIVGLTAEATLGMQATHALGVRAITLDSLAVLAAAEISRGAGHHRSVRTTPVTPSQVATSALVTSPLRELMLPAYATGAAAVVLASEARAGRCTGRSFRVTGWGHATGHHSPDDRWWSDAGASTRTAARQAGVRDAPEAGPFGVIELSSPTPALAHVLASAVAAPEVSPHSTCRRGGLLSCYAGLANGVVRLVEAVEQAEELGTGTRALSHSVDLVTGLVAQDATVVIGEVA